MRCPRCGRDNADGAQFCSACGAALPLPSDAARAETDGQQDEKLSLDARIPDLESSLHSLSDTATRALLEDLDPSEDEEAYAQTPAPTRHAVVNEAALPGMDATALRPAPSPQQDQHFVVRRTRDYDHDAQSVNRASAMGNFETLHQDRPARDGWFDPYARSARKGDVLGEGNSRSKVRPFLAILLIAVVLGAAGAVLTYGMELWGGKRVPYLLGESQAVAEAKLDEKGLVASFEARPADDAIGKVIEQDPELGARVPEGSTVKVVVATNRTMPEVVGLSEEEARSVLKEAGAELIETKHKESSEAEGTVLEVKPAAGELFVSRSTITLTVATPFRVPDVIGKKESDAVDALKEAGLAAEVSYIASQETVRTVVSTEPAAGEVIAEGGTVKVKVSSPYPSDPLHLAEFFDHSSQDVDSFLQKKEFTFDKGYIDSYGNALATYTSKEQGNITFSSQPFVRTTVTQKEGSSNVMATGVPIAGVRIDLPASKIPEGYDKEAVNELVNACGFKGWKGYCTNKTIIIPSGSPKTNAQFVCASGTMNNLIWTVTIVGNGSTRYASATCAKEGLYSSSELEPFDGKVRNYVAYQEAYLLPEFQVKEQKKEEKSDKSDAEKSEEKKDGEEGKNDTNAEQPSEDKQQG